MWSVIPAATACLQSSQNPQSYGISDGNHCGEIEMFHRLMDGLLTRLGPRTGARDDICHQACRMARAISAMKGFMMSETSKPNKRVLPRARLAA